MSITDELRKYARGCAGGMGGDALRHIADHIDAEHERAMAAAALVAGVPVADENMAEHGWIRLPLDADGVPIRVGDVLTDGEYTFTVCELAAFGGGSWSIRNEDGNAWKACDVTHHHKPTVEDVLRECIANVCRSNAQLHEQGCPPLTMEDIDEELDEYINEFAAKLRLAKGEDK